MQSKVYKNFYERQFKDHWCILFTIYSQI
jgi:hypothetical protein